MWRVALTEGAKMGYIVFLFILLAALSSLYIYYIWDCYFKAPKAVHTKPNIHLSVRWRLR